MDNNDPSMRITAYREAVRALEDAQQFMLSQGHVKGAVDIGLSVDSVVSLHLSTLKPHSTNSILYDMLLTSSVCAIRFKVLGGGTSDEGTTSE